jgi:hypothetical protein
VSRVGGAPFTYLSIQPINKQGRNFIRFLIVEFFVLFPLAIYLAYNNRLLIIAIIIIFFSIPTVVLSKKSETGKPSMLKKYNKNKYFARSRCLETAIMLVGVVGVVVFFSMIYS